MKLLFTYLYYVSFCFQDVFLFLGVWTLQPALKPQSEHYMSMLRHINQQEISSR